MEGNISDSFEKILVIRRCGLGDFILTLPFLCSLRKTFPEAQIELMALSSHFALIQGMGLIDRFVPEGSSGLHLFYTEGAKREPSSRFDPSRYDLIIPFTNPDGLLVQNLPTNGNARVHPIRPIPSPNSEIHVVDYLLGQRPDFIEDCEPVPRITMIEQDPPEETEFLKRLLPHDQTTERLLAIHPGSGSKKKNWPAKSFARLISLLRQKGSFFPFLIEGPADREITESILKILGKQSAAVVHHPDLLQLGSLLLRSHLYLGNDSGVTHLAAATGRPVIAIFGPSNPNVWGPRGDFIRIFWKQEPCSPCHLSTDVACNKPICMESITPEDILEEIESQNLASS